LFIVALLLQKKGKYKRELIPPKTLFKSQGMKKNNTTILVQNLDNTNKKSCVSEDGRTARMTHSFFYWHDISMT